MRLPRRAVHAAASSAPKGPFCDHCDRNLAPLPAYIRCAHACCHNLAMCVDCFSVGATDRVPHRPYHPYRVIENTLQPLFHPDWHASEEYRLLTAMSQHGPNHWKPVSEYVGKGMIKCQNHYESVYLQPTPASIPFPVSLVYEHPSFTAAAATAAADNPAPQQQLAPPAAAPTVADAPPPQSASCPAQHTIRTESPSAPKRDDFDVEWDDTAENLIADLELHPTNPQLTDDATLKVLDHFNARLHRRYAVKDYLLEDGILNFSEDASLCLKNEQTLSNRLYALSWLMDHARFKAFYDSVINEFRRAKNSYAAGRRQKAKRKAKDLDANGKAARSKTNVQKRRRTGKARSTPFSKRKRSSAKKQDECPPSPLADATMPNTPASAPMSPNSPASPSLSVQLQTMQPSPAFLRKAKKLRRMVSSASMPPPPKPVDDMEDASQLSPAERSLCAALHIPPTFFLEMKSVTLLTVTALQQRRRNDKQSSSEKIVVPPANFARSLDHVDGQSGSTAKKDASHGEDKDSLILPPLTLPQVVNNHVLSDNNEHGREERGSARCKSGSSRVMDKELLDFLTHIPENNAERMSPDIKQEPGLVGEGQGDKGNGQVVVVKKREVEIELVTGESVGLSEHKGDEMHKPQESNSAQDDRQPLVHSTKDRPARVFEETQQKISTSSGYVPASKNAPSRASEGGTYHFLPSSTANAPGSATSHKEHSPAGLAAFLSEGSERVFESPEQQADQTQPAASSRPRSVLRLIIRPPGKALPNRIGVGKGDPLEDGEGDVLLANGQVHHGQGAATHLGRDAPVAPDDGNGESGGVSNRAPDQGRVYLRNSAHQPTRGVQSHVPMDVMSVSNVNVPPATSHLQLPQSMARFSDLYLQSGQRESTGNNATGAERLYLGQRARNCSASDQNDRGGELQTPPKHMGCTQGAPAANLMVRSEASADELNGMNKAGLQASIAEHARGTPSVNATAGRVYLQPQPLPPAPDTPSVVVEPQSVHVGGHAARFQTEDSRIVPAPPKPVIRVPEALTSIRSEGFEDTSGHRVTGSPAGEASPAVARGSNEMANDENESRGAKRMTSAEREDKPGSSVGEAEKSPLTESSRGEPNPDRVGVTGDDAGSEIEEILLDEGKAETDEDDGQESARESLSSSAGEPESKPGSDDPDYQPSFESRREAGRVKQGGARKKRRGKATRDARRGRSDQDAARKAPQVIDESEEVVSEEVVSEGVGAESEDYEDEEGSPARRRRSLRPRKSSPPRSAVAPTRRSSRIQKRSRRFVENSPDPRPPKKRRFSTHYGSQAEEVATSDGTATVKGGVLDGDDQGGSSLAPGKSVSKRGKRKSDAAKRSIPRRSSGRIVRKTHKVKELEIITPQVDPHSQTLSSDSNKSLQLMPTGVEQGRATRKYGLRRKWSS